MEDTNVKLEACGLKGEIWMELGRNIGAHANSSEWNYEGVLDVGPKWGLSGTRRRVR